ncbi:MAG: hypothetical protein R3C05_03250 [Pirellulaceae bacterium]
MRRKKTAASSPVDERELTNYERSQAERRIYGAIASSPVLRELEIGYERDGNTFYLIRKGEPDRSPLARIRPSAKGSSFVLEAPTDEGWDFFGQGTPNRVIKLFCNDTLGTFHGLGSIDQTLRDIPFEKLRVDRFSDRQFCFHETKKPCSVQETLYFYFGIPLEIVMQPEELYRRHGRPMLLAASDDESRILVRFCHASSSNPSIIGYGYYALINDHWYGVPIPSDEGGTVEQADRFFRANFKL